MKNRKNFNKSKREKEKPGCLLILFQIILMIVGLYILIPLVDYIDRFINNLTYEEAEVDSRHIEKEPVTAPVTPTTPPIKSNKPQAECEKNIKGNISSSGEKIYHVSSGDFYDATVAEEIFCTQAEAKAAGYRKSKR